ncbi:MAG: hypothetical protein RIR22_894, partial [Planctomycetota bacterium]
MSNIRAGPKAWLIASTFFINMNVIGYSNAEEQKFPVDPPPLLPSKDSLEALTLEDRIKRLELRNDELRA